MDSQLEKEVLYELLCQLERYAPDMKVSQAKVLLATAVWPGSKQAFIADRAGLTMSGMTRAYDVMSNRGRRDKTGQGDNASNVKMGLLCKDPHPEDLRSWVMNLTMRGEKAIEDLVAIIRKVKG